MKFSIRSLGFGQLLLAVAIFGVYSAFSYLGGQSLLKDLCLPNGTHVVLTADNSWEGTRRVFWEHSNASQPLFEKRLLGWVQGSGSWCEFSVVATRDSDVVAVAISEGSNSLRIVGILRFSTGIIFPSSRVPEGEVAEAIEMLARDNSGKLFALARSDYLSDDFVLIEKL